MPEKLPEFRSARACGAGACVEVAVNDASVHVRASRDPAGRVLTFDLEEWSTFLTGARAGDFDVR